MPINPMANDEIHLWFYPEGALGSERLYSEGLGLLTSEERQRYQSFSHSKRSRQFLFGRLLLRRCLASYLTMDAGALEFSYDENGKPELPVEITGDLVFSLSHTNSNVVVAISQGERIGVDLEILNRASSAFNIAQSFFSKVETTQLGCKDRSASEEALILWSLKESIMKAIGGTVWEGLSSVQLALNKNQIQWLDSSPKRPEPNWFLMCGYYPGESILALALHKKRPICQLQKVRTYVLGSELVDTIPFRILGSSCPSVVA